MIYNTYNILGHINLGKKGYRVPPSGTIQVTLFNPLGTVVKMFVVMYDLTDMPPNSQVTFQYVETRHTIRDLIINNLNFEPNCNNKILVSFQTFLRQRTFYMPTSEGNNEKGLVIETSQKWLRYLIHLR